MFGFLKGLGKKKEMKKCDVCGKEVGDGVKRADGMMFCCLACRSHCEKMEAKDKPIEKGKVCEFC